MKEIKDMTIEEKIGQMIMIGIYGYDVDENTKKFIEKYKVGGIIIFRRNVESSEQLQNLINSLKEINLGQNNIPLFIATDHEGGRVNRLPLDIKKFPPLNEIGKLNDNEYTLKYSKCLGETVARYGFNMLLNPVLDIKTMEDNKHAIGDRAISENPDIVSNVGVHLIKGIKESNLIPVIKHFPGQGMTQLDTHAFLPKVKNSIEDIENNHLRPFKDAIKNGANCVLISHMIVNEFDKINPASLSNKVISKVLREKLNFNDGVVITDDLMMKGLVINNFFSIPIVKAVNAGNDILLLCHDNTLKENAIKKLTEAVKKGIISEDRINESVERILRLKVKYNINDKHIEKLSTDQINKNIIDFL